MTEFEPVEVVLLRASLAAFKSHVEMTVDRPVRQFLELRPARLVEFNASVAAITKVLEEGPGADNKRISTEHLPVLKRALLFKLKEKSQSCEERSRLTSDGDTKAQIDAEMEPYRFLADGAWFTDTEAAPTPVLRDYLVSSKDVGGQPDLSKREFDEKFGILTGPRLILEDLAYYRYQCCELRNRHVSVAFVDIDNFKEFNSDHGEPWVDQEVLPIFMRVLESVTYGQGHAYRHGGDEYVVILPNRRIDEAADFLASFQVELSRATYKDIQSNPTVSIGICEVTSQSALTDREVEGWAATAKQFAKDAGRNRIAGVSGPLPDKNSIRIHHPQ